MILERMAPIPPPMAVLDIPRLIRSRSVGASRSVILRARRRVMAVEGIVLGVLAGQPRPVTGEELQDLVGEERAAEVVRVHLLRDVEAVGAAVAAGGLAAVRAVVVGVGCEDEVYRETFG